MKIRLKTLTITERQWKRIREATFVNINSILQAVEKLIKNLEDDFINFKSPVFVASALYTHAVEEFGKLYYLKNLRPKKGKITIEYNLVFKGKTSHEKKFELAISNLPKNCIVLQHGSHTKMSYSQTSYSIETFVSWQTRLSILNADIDKQGDFIKPPLINHFTLLEAVNSFRKFIEDYKY